MSMFGKKKPTAVDITKKPVRTWWGGTKWVPTTKSEQKKLKAELLKQDPHLTVIDSAAKKRHELDWIDRMEEFDAFMDDDPF
jgi:hypothetical protein